MGACRTCVHSSWWGCSSFWLAAGCSSWASVAAWASSSGRSRTLDEPGLMRILITNDDGVHAPGLLALKRALDPIAEVTVVAPDRPRSASGHSITLHKPLRLSQTALADGSPAYTTSGTPSDCVTLALLEVMRDRRPEL